MNYLFAANPKPSLPHEASLYNGAAHSIRSPPQSSYSFKLIYFEDRGKADLVRLLFACASGVACEEIQVKQSEWNMYKSYMPFEQLPVLVVNNSLKIAQTNTICRFLAAKFGLNGSDELESVACDMVVEQLRECAEQAIQCMQETDGVKRAQLLARFLSETLSKTLVGYEKMLNLNSDKYIVGKRLTWADLAMVNAWEWLDDTSRQLLDNYPSVRSHNEFIRSLPSVAEWFKSQRPLRVLKKA